MPGKGKPAKGRFGKGKGWKETEVSRKRGSTGPRRVPGEKAIEKYPSGGSASGSEGSEENVPSRRLFTVGEDHRILHTWRKMKNRKSLLQIAEELAEKLERSKDSVRDRIRRYLARLTDNEVASLENMYKVLRILTLEKPFQHSNVPNPRLHPRVDNTTGNPTKPGPRECESVNDEPPAPCHLHRSNKPSPKSQEASTPDNRFE